MSWLKLFRTKNKLPLPPEWEAYLQHFKHPYTRKTPLRELRFVVLDLETTGLDVKKDRMLSLGAVAIENQQIRISERLECFVSQANYTPNESVGIHGITSKTSAGGITEEEVILHLLSFCGQSIIVGHHIGFDLAMINQVTQRLWGKRIKNKAIDTAYLAQRLHPPRSFEPAFQAFSLDAVCQQFHIPLEERHTAAGDAFLTAILFLKIMGRLEKRGLKTLADLWRFQTRP